MKKFRFPLRPVAVLREHHQARTRDAFAVTIREMNAAEDRLHAKRTERHELEALMHDGRRETFRPAEEISILDAYQRFCAEEKKLEQAVASAHAAMEESRKIY